MLRFLPASFLPRPAIPGPVAMTICLNIPSQTKNTLSFTINGTKNNFLSFSHYRRGRKEMPDRHPVPPRSAEKTSFAFLSFYLPCFPCLTFL
ncbi:hypothetical protein ED312_11335 [Sinomicrobium pectinilyticum]|uniref:Uncharacterized protein n=1 Tax=Sinomicrobium pectinilyticum TaxID=1084421 RepID=A0A3N0EEM0_SINP1|nr:hypothetical protein ED312_11335 [Sinomicrobium pectinilyticum]